MLFTFSIKDICYLLLCRHCHSALHSLLPTHLSKISSENFSWKTSPQGTQRFIICEIG